MYAQAWCRRRQRPGALHCSTYSTKAYRRVPLETSFVQPSSTRVTRRFWYTRAGCDKAFVTVGVRGRSLYSALLLGVRK